MVIARQWGATACFVVAASAHAASQTTLRASVDSSGVQANQASYEPCLSADGRYVAFISEATNLVPGDTNATRDVFVRDLLGGVTTRASVSSSEVQANNVSDPWLSISSDGRYVAFVSWATNLVPSDTNGAVDVFVRDLLAGVTTRVSVDSSGTAGNQGSYAPAISADGRCVAFTSYSTNLFPGDTNFTTDVFIHDLQSGSTVCASVDPSDAQGDDFSIFPSLSADGRYVAFWSIATNLVPGDTTLHEDLFVRDLQNGTTILASVSTSGEQANQGNAFYERPSISADGRFVAFLSDASNLVPGDTNAQYDVFVRDLQNEVTTRANVSTSGEETQHVNHHDYAAPSISADGRYVAFLSNSPVLVPGDTNDRPDHFLRDLQEGVTTRTSVASSGEEGDDGGIAPPSISGDGRCVAFESHSTNLAPGDTNGQYDVFVRDWWLPPVVASCFGDGSGSACPCGNSGLAARGCDNSVSTGGARLSARGTRRVSEDTFVLTSAGGLPTSFSVFFQGTSSVGPFLHGDGLRCIGGSLKRLYAKSASGGIVSAPAGADPSVSARSAALGEPILPGATRRYQVLYRDPNPSFCPDPPGNTWNDSNMIEAVWGF